MHVPEVITLRRVFVAGFLVIGLVFLWQVYGQGQDKEELAGDLNTSESQKDKVTNEALDLRADVLKDCRSGRPTLRPQTCQAALELGEVIEEVETDDPEIQEGEVDDPEKQDAEFDDPEIQNPEIQNPEHQDPDSNDPEEQDDEIQDPDSDDPETQDEEFDDPENQEPEIQEPEQQDPEQQDPEIDDPDPNDEPVSPYPFTFDFEFMGMTFFCTIDSPNDNSCTSEPAP